MKNGTLTKEAFPFLFMFTCKFAKDYKQKQWTCYSLLTSIS